MGFAEKEMQRKKDGVVGKIVRGKVSDDTEKVNIGTQKKKVGRPKVNRETKKRFTLTLMPSNYEKAMEIAYNDGLSVSELVDEYLAQYVQERERKI